MNQWPGAVSVQDLVAKQIWTDFELVMVNVQLILFGGTRPQARHAYVETHDRQWIISSVTVQSHDFLVVYGYYGILEFNVPLNTV